jgi:DNA recombination protein RmuC
MDSVLLLLAATLLCSAAAVTLAYLAWRKSPPPPDWTPIAGRLDSIDRAQERVERSVRDEIAHNRGDAAIALEALRAGNEQKLESIRLLVDRKLTAMQQSNETRLEQMRQTVDEKLQGTLEKRLGESFQIVSERLEQVHRGLGEMQSLAAGVGDLKKVLTNVKVRGTWGEVQLGALLEQMLTPEQFGRNVAVSGTNERVEFAVRLPDEDETVWLPVDSKFPQEDYERLVLASEAGDPVAVEVAAVQLEKRLRHSAKEISQKYICPPRTADFAVLFLPTEGLYAEVLRRPGLAEGLLREYKVHITGPTTLGALLSSLRYSFQRVAMQRKSTEVWKVLGAAKTEFSKYAEVLVQVKKKLEEASNTVDRAAVRTRAIERSLRDVEGSQLVVAAGRSPGLFDPVHDDPVD